MSYEKVTLKQLEKGSESAWPIAHKLILERKITKQDALNALEKCLEIKIPEYRQASQMEITSGNYWKNRLSEAEQALQAIKNNYPEVIYKEITL